MNTYIFLQQYWWFVVSLLGAILVFLLFVQGGNSLIFCLGKTEEQRKMIINSTGRKWEFTFTTLVTFGGAFFASAASARTPVTPNAVSTSAMHDSPSNLALLPSFLVFILIFLLFFHMKVKPENALFFSGSLHVWDFPA